MPFRKNPESRKKVVAFSRGPDAEVKKLAEIEEISGKLSFQKIEDKLMHSVLDNDREVIEEGKIIKESLNRGISSLTPSSLFEKMIKNYSLAQQLFGETMIQLLSGYEPDYVKKNLGIPEFQRQLRKNIEENIEKLKEEGLLQRNGFITEKGLELASLVSYVEELDEITPKGIFGEKLYKRASVYGDKTEVRNYRKGDRYRDISIKKSAKLSIRRGHRTLSTSDLRVFDRESKGQVNIIYALDASASMKGDKIDKCKKAGIALAYKAIDQKDKVGLIVFGSEVKSFVEPTNDFTALLKEITSIRPSKQTDLAKTLQKAIEMFPSDKITKHLILITDAMPTIGESPEKETLEQVSTARNSGITISIIGINLNDKGKALAERVVEVGEGKLYVVRDTDEVDRIVLEDYYSMTY